MAIAKRWTHRIIGIYIFLFLFWKKPSDLIGEKYGWWKKSCTSWGKGSLSHYLQGFQNIPGGCLGFLLSTVSSFGAWWGRIGWRLLSLFPLYLQVGEVSWRWPPEFDASTTVWRPWWLKVPQRKLDEIFQKGYIPTKKPWFYDLYRSFTKTSFLWKGRANGVYNSIAPCLPGLLGVGVGWGFWHGSSLEMELKIFECWFLNNGDKEAEHDEKNG